MAILRQTNKKTGITDVIESESYQDKEKQRLDISGRSSERTKSFESLVQGLILLTAGIAKAPAFAPVNKQLHVPADRTASFLLQSTFYISVMIFLFGYYQLNSVLVWMLIF